jgi:hypothetical protein
VLASTPNWSLPASKTSARGAAAIASSHSVIEVHAIVADARAAQRLVLRREVLLIGRAAGIADQETRPRLDRSPRLCSGVSSNEHLTTTPSRPTHGARKDQPATTCDGGD